jgi:hypothetical protein
MKSMFRILIPALPMLLLLLSISRISACFVCVAEPMESALIRELQGSEELVLAYPTKDGDEGTFKVTKVLRSNARSKAGIGIGTSIGDVVEADLPLFSVDGGKIGRATVLLTRNRGSKVWIIRAPASSPEQTDFFDEVLSEMSAGAGDVLDEINRAVFFIAYLHHEDPLLAKAAAAELAKMPYPVMKRVRTKLDVQKIRQELAKQGLVKRRAFFQTLLGLCGEPQDRAWVRTAVENTWQRRGAKNLGSLLTAYLELAGDMGFDEIERRYLLDRERTLPEIEAALAALRVHGNANQAVVRARVIKAFRLMFDEREPLVFLIIGDLARWGDWDSKERLVELVKRRGAESRELRQQVEQYIIQCPE